MSPACKPFLLAAVLYVLCKPRTVNIQDGSTSQKRETESTEFGKFGILVNVDEEPEARNGDVAVLSDVFM